MENPQVPPAHWCHQCSAEITPEPAASGALVCPNCGGGFIETMESARTLADVRHMVQRHERLHSRRGRSVGDAPHHEGDVSDVQDMPSDFPDVSHELNAHGSQHGSYQNSILESPPMSSVPRFSSQVDIANQHEIVGESTEEGSINLNGNEDDEESDSEAEVSLLELSDWSSFEDEDAGEWEEDEEVRFLQALDDVVQDRQHEDEEGEGEEAQGHIRLDEIRSHFLPRILRHRLHAIRRNLQSFNVEDEIDTYVGNLGDYVDARGFEELLQQFIDTDNTRRGAPPASKSAIESLPTVLIQQENVENGSASCAICKEVVALDEPVKQLPCLHLYHSSCILPWLSARNSCPVCRYELPTDDPDYEEQRKHSTQLSLVQTGDRNHSSTASQDAGGEGTSTEQRGNGESVQTETIELFAESVKEEGRAGSESSVRADRSGNGDANERSSLLEVIAGPLLSVVGLVVVSCLGNLFLGGGSQKPSRVEIGRVRGVQNCRPWWMNFFR